MVDVEVRAWASGMANDDRYRDIISIIDEADERPGLSIYMKWNQKFSFISIILSISRRSAWRYLSWDADGEMMIYQAWR